MSYNINDLFVARNSRSASYQIEQSLRFNSVDSARLSRTPSSSGNLRTGTISFWIKRSKLQSAPVQNTQMSLLGCTGNGPFFLRYRYQYDYLEYGQGWAGGTGGFETLAHYRDVSAWQHVCLVNDFTNATAADRVRLYMNGVRQDLTITTAFTNADGSWNSTNVHYIGYQAAYFDGYMAEFHNVDGTALDPDNFGEYDNNGVWRPIEYTGSYGTNGFYLKFDPSATNGIGHDHSGNGNNWTPTNFTTSGTTELDVLSDTPTNNYCTWNPLFKQGGSPSYSQGNLNVSGDPGSPILGTIGVSSGKWYWEVQPSSDSSLIGICGPVLSSYSGNLYDQSTGYCYANDGRKGNNGSLSSYGASYSGGDIIGVALDLDAGTLVFYKNGTSQGTAFTGLSGTFFPAVSDWGTNINFTLNCGQRAFVHTPPTDFNALNTSNLPAPSIKDGSKHFSANLWTGNGTTNHALTGFGFQPDFVWGKARSQSYAHTLFDSVRGGAYRLYINNSTPPGQDYLAEYIKSFDSDGITVGSDANLNGTNVTYVGWSWKAGGTVSANNNTDGDITTTVSANPDAGFSIIKYTSSNTAGDGIGHGLGKPPAFFIIKSMDSSDHYAVYHQSMGNSSALLMNSPNNAYTGTVWWNNTSPNNTVITLGTETSVNNSSSDDYICWAWAEIEGYSKFGVIKGNYTSDGPFVYLGFTPAFLMFKNAERTSTDWALIDTSRDPYNYAGRALRPNQANSEDTYTERLDILSNGFKLRTSDLNYNGPDDAPGIIYAAFAEHPFGGDGVSPATAR